MVPEVIFKDVRGESGTSWAEIASVASAIEINGGYTSSLCQTGRLRNGSRKWMAKQRKMQRINSKLKYYFRILNIEYFFSLKIVALFSWLLTVCMPYVYRIAVFCHFKKPIYWPLLCITCSLFNITSSCHTKPYCYVVVVLTLPAI